MAATSDAVAFEQLAEREKRSAVDAAVEAARVEAEGQLSAVVQGRRRRRGSHWRRRLRRRRVLC